MNGAVWRHHSAVIDCSKLRTAVALAGLGLQVDSGLDFELHLVSPNVPWDGN